MLEPRSPYFTRPVEQTVSSEGEETEVVEREVDQGAGTVIEGSDSLSGISEREEVYEMATGDDSEVKTLLRIMCERDAQYKRDLLEAAEARREEEEKARKANEEARRADLREMFTQIREMEDAKAEKLRKIEDAKAEKIRELEELRLTKFREEEAERRRAEDVARRDRKEDEDRAKEKKERQQEKLRGLGMFREASDLCAYLDRFERIMTDCEINRAEWSERLFARLTERLCMKVSELMDEGADYEILKGALLKAVGETTITYGHKLFELTGEALKAKTGDEVVDTICRICKGLFQGAKSVEECVFALAMAVTRQVIPSSGKVFIENGSYGRRGVRELREAWCEGVTGGVV